MSKQTYKTRRNTDLDAFCDETAGQEEEREQGRLLNELEALELADLFKALADPTRVRIIAALYEGEMCVHDLAELLQMSQSSISHQLRLLRSLHLVAYRKDGRHAFYRLVDDHVRDLFRRSREHLEC